MYIKYQFPNITLVIMKVLGSSGDILHRVRNAQWCAGPCTHTTAIRLLLQTRQLQQI